MHGFTKDINSLELLDFVPKEEGKMHKSFVLKPGDSPSYEIEKATQYNTYEENLHDVIEKL